MNESVRICQMRTTPVANSPASRNAHAICTNWDPSNSFCRSVRSANTPPTRENRTIGMLPRNESRPSIKGDLESCKTSQACAKVCIRVPMLEVHAPNHMMRKSRYAKALKTRFSNGISELRQRLGALNQVQIIPVGIVEVDQPVA